MGEPAERLIVALDVPDTAKAENLVHELGNSVTFYKIGYQLAFAGGLEFARELVSDGKQVFLDMKLLDIDNTISSAIENIARIGVSMTTLHAYPKAMRAAAEAARGSGLCLLGVTVLTSMDDADLVEAGYTIGTRDLVLKRARQAQEAGLGGVVASAREAASIRDAVNEEFAIVTPGIRPAGSDTGDQKRVMTPSQAIAAGASHLVVGRPVATASNPAEVAAAITAEIASACRK